MAKRKKEDFDWQDEEQEEIIYSTYNIVGGRSVRIL